jgi:prepilin-type N-terminal cleavage/methylation domain-containing protein
MLIEEKGFTLTEMLVAISVLGILMAAAAVGLGTLAPQFDLDNAARKVAMALNQGRVQAITRGHTMVVTFDTDAFTITDDVDHETIATDSFPPHIAVSADSDTTFTPLGTVTAPVTVTVSNSDGSREVSVGLIGEVQIQ